MSELPETLNQGSPDEAHLIGQLLDDTPVYWHLSSGGIIMLDDDGPQTQYAIDEENVEAYVLEREHTEPKGWKELTPLGDFLRQTAPYQGVGGFDGDRLIPHRQVEAYAMRELLSLSRPRVAEYMGISPNTVDNHYQRAQAKVGQALGIANAVETFRDANEQAPDDELLNEIKQMQEQIVDKVESEYGMPIEDLEEEVRDDSS